MEPVPDHQALFGLDVIKASGNEGYHLKAVSDAVIALLDEALSATGTRPEVLSRDFTGDGELLTFSASSLGVVLDLTDRLNRLAEARNRRYRPEIRLRMAIELGPVRGDRQLTAPKISLARMLDAPAFKTLVDRCLATGRTLTQSALICSDNAWRTAFSGDHTGHVHRDEFAPIPVVNKEYTTTARVRVPGFDADSLARMLADPPPSDSAGPSAAARPTEASGRCTPIAHVGGDVTGSVIAGRVDGPLTINNRHR